MRIQRKSIVTLPKTTGNIVDTLNVEDKITNAPSINLVQMMAGVPEEGIIEFDGDEIPEGYEEVDYDTDWVWLDQEVGILYRKKGDLVTLAFSSSANMTLTGWANTTIVSLPSDIRPNLTLRFSVYSKRNNNIYWQLFTNGNVDLFHWGSEATFEAGQLAFTLTYFV